MIGGIREASRRADRGQGRCADPLGQGGPRAPAPVVDLTLPGPIWTFRLVGTSPGCALSMWLRLWGDEQARYLVRKGHRAGRSCFDSACGAGVRVQHASRTHSRRNAAAVTFQLVRALMMVGTVWGCGATRFRLTRAKTSRRQSLAPDEHIVLRLFRLARASGLARSTLLRRTGTGSCRFDSPEGADVHARSRTGTSGAASGKSVAPQPIVSTRPRRARRADPLRNRPLREVSTRQDDASSSKIALVRAAAFQLARVAR